jgi:hypothetical protein
MILVNAAVNINTGILKAHTTFIRDCCAILRNLIGDLQPPSG